VTVRLAGDVEREKSGARFTVNASVAVWLRLPEVPVIVTVAVPVAALLLAVSVSVLLVVAEAGLNDAVTPLGKPDADRFTLDVNPFCGTILTVLVPLVPRVIGKLAGEAEKLKSGDAVALTVSANVVV
jgi:hypothetical protein